MGMVGFGPKVNFPLLKSILAPSLCRSVRPISMSFDPFCSYDTKTLFSWTLCLLLRVPCKFTVFPHNFKLFPPTPVKFVLRVFPHEYFTPSMVLACTTDLHAPVSTLMGVIFVEPSILVSCSTDLGFSELIAPPTVRPAASQLE